MKILVTGGAGFIGSHLSERILKKNHEVVAVDSFCSSHRQNIQDFEYNEDFALIEQDVLEPLEVEDLDYVLHFASRASPVDYQDNPVHTLRTNSEGTLKLLELANENGARFLYASTSEVYGDPEVHPQPEEYNGNVNFTGPRACYDEGKRFGEAAITSYARKNTLDYRIVRIFNTYGPRMRPEDGRVVSNFITQALRGEPLTVYGDGFQTRSFCYVDDLIDGILKLMEAESGTILNLGNPEEYTIKELAEKVKEMTGSDSNIIHEKLPEDDPERRKPDISRAEEVLEWNPDTGLEEGLESTVEYFKEIVRV